MKKVALLAIPAVFVVLLMVLAACAESKATITSTNIVKMQGGTFTISTITIRKGENISFVEEGGTGGIHILVTGQNAQGVAEQGAPDFGGNSGIRVDVGQVWNSPPWTIAGTFHVTCTVHPLMNLVVVVT